MMRLNYFSRIFIFDVFYKKNNNMTYEELLISIDLKGYENVLPKIGRSLNDNYWFIVCDDGDCHLFDRYGKEDDISKIKKINEAMISKDIKKIVIPNSVTSIGHGAFYDCNKLTSVTIGNNVMSIGHIAFFRCTNLMSVTIPDSVTSIGNETFDSCHSLTSITIPDNVMSIGEYAFYNCTELTNVMIGNRVTSIGDKTFSWCCELTNVIIDKPIEQVKAMKFYPWGIKDKSIIKCIQ